MTIISCCDQFWGGDPCFNLVFWTRPNQEECWQHAHLTLMLIPNFDPEPNRLVCMHLLLLCFHTAPSLTYSADRTICSSITDLLYFLLVTSDVHSPDDQCRFCWLILIIWKTFLWKTKKKKKISSYLKQHQQQDSGDLTFCHNIQKCTFK